MQHCASDIRRPHLTSCSVSDRPSAAHCTICDGDLALLRSPVRPPYELTPAMRVVDLFSGSGGLSLGIAEAARAAGVGIEHRLAVDDDVDAHAAFLANFPCANTRLGPVEDLFDGNLGDPLTPREVAVREEVGPHVECLAGGPPCQGHSNLNNHTRRRDVRNSLYSRMGRAAEVLRPDIVIIENVPGVIHAHERVVSEVRRALEDLRYVVEEAVVDLLTVGIPQRRRRHVLLAYEPPHLGILPAITTRCVEHPKRTVKWAIEDLVDRPRAAGVFDTGSTTSPANTRRIAWLHDANQYDLPNHLRPDCHRGDHSYRSMYGRLRWDEPAQTITSGFGSMGQGRYVHPSQRRTLTPHEAARLQGLPDFFSWGGTDRRTSIARLIGNAVPPALPTAILGPLMPRVHRLVTDRSPTSPSALGSDRVAV